MIGSASRAPSCREILDRLADWAEGHLGDGDEEPYRHHLELCPPCGSLARTYRALPAVARAALAAEMPGEARDRLRRLLLARFGAAGRS